MVVAWSNNPNYYTLFQLEWINNHTSITKEVAATSVTNTIMSYKT